MAQKRLASSDQPTVNQKQQSKHHQWLIALCSFSYSTLNTAPAESVALVMCFSVACISARDLTLRYRM
jgi:hypothetical protein